MLPVDGAGFFLLLPVDGAPRFLLLPVEGAVLFLLLPVALGVVPVVLLSELVEAELGPALRRLPSIRLSESS